MSSTPERYQPSPRLVDQPDELDRLYNEEGLTVREIADEHADVGRTAVSDALQDYGITDTTTATTHTQSTGRTGGGSARSLTPAHANTPQSRTSLPWTSCD